ncbi:SPOR domain-containing protein [Luteimonas sp. Y-2-2-4F]|nr:SPOR domain-containing protein [Luteimonas sp. Y-2-2-4F]MCD9031374.1 SPOR domain-containing protein [Luteimonas sp. Y-2-2-4F]
MDSGLKQRLIGAAVLIALAVIFLPMLVKGPAPDSGVSDLPLDLPETPRGEVVTRDLPLIAPPPAPEDGGVLEAQRRGGTTPASTPAPAPSGELPTVDTAAAPRASAAGADASPALPATTAGGAYAVHFGSYGNSVDAETVVNRLRADDLPAESARATVSGKAVWRVRIGPYASRADAEAVRVAASRVGTNDARVIALDAAPAAAAAPPQQAQAPSTPPATPAPAPATPAPSAAAGTGFVVQLGAFSNAADAEALRDRVRAAGISAFTDTVQTERGRLTRVKAGPVLDRAEADRLRAQIQGKTGVNGLVRSNP